MRPSLALQIHRAAIRKLRCVIASATYVCSVLPCTGMAAETTLMDIAKIQVEVTCLLNVSVDELTPNALPANSVSE